LKADVNKIDISVAKFSDNLFSKTTYEIIMIVEQEAPLNSVEVLVQKRYTEFQGFYESLTYRYTNLKFPSFPSKYQLLNQKETRKKFFDSLLKTTLKLARAHSSIRKELLKLLYEFILDKENDTLEIKNFQEKLKKENENFSNSGYFDNSSSMDKGSVIDTLSQNTKEEVQQGRTSVNFEKKMTQSSYVNDSILIANMFDKDDTSCKIFNNFRFLANRVYLLQC
jgi:hypothetical protein